MEEIEVEKEKKPGALSIVSLTLNERETLLDYLDAQNPALNASFLFAILGEDFLKYLDVMAGETIKVPTRESILKMVSYVKVYAYCKNGEFSEATLEKASKIYGRRVASIQRVIAKVDRVLNKLEEDSEDE